MEARSLYHLLDADNASSPAQRVLSWYRRCGRLAGLRRAHPKVKRAILLLKAASSKGLPLSHSKRAGPQSLTQVWHAYSKEAHSQVHGMHALAGDGRWPWMWRGACTTSTASASSTLTSRAPTCL
jgi:hypothetical protein